MKRYIQNILFIIGTLFLIIGCQGSGGGGDGGSDSPPPDGSSATIIVEFSENLQGQISSAEASVFNTQPAAVNKVVLNARAGDKDLVSELVLTSKNGIYSATVSDIPSSGEVLFWVFAYDESGMETYAASKSYSRSADTTGSIQMPMKKTDTIPLPRIKSMVIDEAIEISTESTIYLQLEGPGFPIDFEFESLENTGQLSLKNTKIIPKSDGTALIAINYQSPATDRLYDYTIKYTNHNGSELYYKFKTNVVPKGLGEPPQSLNSAWVRSFSPKFRVNDRLYWDVAIDVEGESEEEKSDLSYSLSFEPKKQGEHQNVKFVGTVTDGPTMINYNEEVEGTVSLEVANSKGVVIQSQYNLSKHKFPECDDECEDPTLGNEYEESVYVGQETTLYLFDYISRWSWYKDYEWTIFSQPSGSAVTILDSKAKNLKIVPTVIGDYLIRLVVSKWNSYKVSWITLKVIDQNFLQTTLRLERYSENIYHTTLLSPQTDQNKQLKAISDIGIHCQGISELEGLNGYIPEMKDGGYQIKNISFSDVRYPLLPVGFNHNLFSFKCENEPNIVVGGSSKVAFMNKIVLGNNIAVTNTIQGNQTKLKPIIRMESIDMNNYRVLLLTKISMQNFKLVGVNNLGMQCSPDISAFGGLIGANGYNMNLIQFKQYQSISFVDLNAAKKTAGDELALFEFQCTGHPEFVGGDTVSISYQGQPAITGAENIIFKGL